MIKDKLGDLEAKILCSNSPTHLQQEDQRKTKPAFTEHFTEELQFLGFQDIKLPRWSVRGDSPVSSALVKGLSRLIRQKVDCYFPLGTQASASNRR